MALAKILHRLPAMGVRDVLATLEEQRRRGGPSETPLTIELVLASGTTMAGDLLFYDDKRAVVGILRSQSSQLGYFKVDEIVGVLVETNEAALRALAPELASLDLSRRPSRLELTRKLTAVANGAAVDIVWATIPEDDFYYALLERLIRDLEDVVAEIRADDLGRSSLKAKVKTWRIEAGGAATVGLLEGALSIKLKASPTGPEAPTKLELKKGLEAAL